MCLFNVFHRQEARQSRVAIPSLDEALCAPCEVKVLTQNVSSTFLVQFLPAAAADAGSVVFTHDRVEVSVASLGFSVIAPLAGRRLELAHLSLQDFLFRRDTSEKTADSLLTLRKLTLDNPSEHKPVFPKVLSSFPASKGSSLGNWLGRFGARGPGPGAPNFLEVRVSKSRLKNGALFDCVSAELQALRLSLEEVWLDRVLGFALELARLQKKARRTFEHSFEGAAPSGDSLAPFLWQRAHVQNFQRTFVKQVRVSGFEIRLHFLQNLAGDASSPLNQMKAQALRKLGLLVPNLRGIRLAFEPVRESHAKYLPLDIAAGLLRRSYVSQAIRLLAAKLPQILVSSMVRIPKSLFNIAKDSLANLFSKEDPLEENFLEVESDPTQ